MVLQHCICTVYLPFFCFLLLINECLHATLQLHYHQFLADTFFPLVGSELLLSEGLLGRLVTLMKTEQSMEVRVACIRTLSQLVKRPDRVSSDN